MMADFGDLFTAEELRSIQALDTPYRIQSFLDAIPYSTEDCYRCPRRVWRERRAHCFDGAVFAAAMLRRLGDPPLVVDMFADNDDDHVIAVYRRNGRWGAVAKSNFVGLRFREPVYRSLRELIMSYFEDFFNVVREKTLRSYTRPLNLKTFDRYNWLADDSAMERIAFRLEHLRRIPLLTPEMVACLSPVDERSYRAGLLGADPEGLYKPGAFDGQMPVAPG